MVIRPQVAMLQKLQRGETGGGGGGQVPLNMVIRHQVPKLQGEEVWEGGDQVCLNL